MVLLSYHEIITSQRNLLSALILLLLPPPLREDMDGREGHATSRRSSVEGPGTEGSHDVAQEEDLSQQKK